MSFLVIMEITKKHIQIIEKAEALFATKGYEGTTVRDIADAAGVNIAMISYYFGSKEKLLEALFMERMNATKHRIEAVVKNQSLTPFQKIETLIDEYITRVEEKKTFYRIMLSEQVINKNTVVLNLMRELKLTYAQLISSVIEEGQKQKIFKKDVDIVLMLTTMTGTVMFMLINKDYYREFNNQKKLTNKVFEEQLSTKLREHVKTIFKAHLGYEL